MASPEKTRTVLTRHSAENIPQLILEVDSVSGDSYSDKCIESSSSQSFCAEGDAVRDQMHVDVCVDTALDEELDLFESDTDSDFESEDLSFLDNVSHTSDRPLKFTLRKLYGWCTRNHVKLNLKRVTSEALDKILSRFYGEIRCQSGQHYAKNTIVAIRYGINRHFQNMNPPRKIDIIEDAEFKRANEVFRNVVVSAARENPNRLTLPLKTEDLRKIYNSQAFSPNTPLTLLLKVWFELSIYFSQNRTKIQRETKSSDFVFDVDSDGRRFVKLSGEIKSNVRMYEKPLDEMCPVSSLEKLIMKVDQKCQYLFQRPRQVFYANNRLWFQPKRVGRNFMSQMMSRICKLANLDTKYTNLSLKKLAPWGLEELVFHYRHLVQSGICRKPAGPVPIAPKTSPSIESVPQAPVASSTATASPAPPPTSSTNTAVCNQEDHKRSFLPYVRRTHTDSDRSESVYLDVSTAKSKIKRIFQRLDYPDLVTFLNWLKRIDVVKDPSGTILCRENCFTFSEEAPSARQFTPRQILPAPSSQCGVQAPLSSLILPSPLSLSQYYMNSPSTTAVRPAAFLIPTFDASPGSNTGFCIPPIASVRPGENATADDNGVTGCSVGAHVLERPRVLQYDVPLFPPTRSSLCFTSATNQRMQTSFPDQVYFSGSTHPCSLMHHSLTSDTTLATTSHYTRRCVCRDLESRENRRVTSDSRQSNRIGSNNHGFPVVCPLSEGSPEKKLKISHITGESKEWKIL